MVVGASEFDGSILGFLGVRIGCALLSLFNIGIGIPWAVAWWQGWVTSHTVINGRRLHFTGSGGSLLWRWIKMEFFMVITLGIYGLWAWRYMKRWTVEHTEFAA